MSSNVRHAQTVEGEDEDPLNPSQDDENPLFFKREPLQVIDNRFLNSLEMRLPYYCIFK